MKNLLSAAQIAALDSAQFEALKNALIEAEQLQSAKALINALTEMVNEGEFNLSEYLDMLRNEVAQFAPPTHTRRNTTSGARNTTGNLLLSEQTTYKPYASINQAQPGTVPGDVLAIIQKSAGITFDNIVTELRNMPQHSEKSAYNVRQSARESIWKLSDFLRYDDDTTNYHLLNA